MKRLILSPFLKHSCPAILSGFAGLTVQLGIILNKKKHIPKMKMITEAARDFRIFVFLSITERGTGDARGTIFCNLVAISPEAGMVGNHRKLIPTFDERLVWGFGDGFGLEAYDVKGAKAGGLNCWENWMPLARYALYCGGEDIHVSTWPGADAEATRIVKTIAKEGRVWSIAPSGILSIDDIPTSFALYDEIRESGETQFFNGGSSIVEP